jgi:hypothetical protein
MPHFNVLYTSFLRKRIPSGAGKFFSSVEFFVHSVLLLRPSLTTLYFPLTDRYFPQLQVRFSHTVDYTSHQNYVFIMTSTQERVAHNLNFQG